MIPADIPKVILRSIFARGLRVSVKVSWWERLVERLGIAERWEYRDSNGKWIKFWRRNGSVPDAAIGGRQ